MEWGIKGLKRKWEGLMKRFVSTKPKFNHLFQFVALSLISHIRGGGTSHKR
jgi:hypothetical protein